MAEKDTIELESGTNAVAAREEEQADAVIETPGAGEAMAQAEAVAMDHATANDKVAGEAAPANAVSDDSSTAGSAAATTDHAGADNIGTDGAAPADAGADEPPSEDAATHVSSEKAGLENAFPGDLPAEAGVADATADHGAAEDLATDEAAVDDSVAPETVVEDAAAAPGGSDGAAVADAVTGAATNEDARSDVAAASDLAAVEAANESFEPLARASAELKAILEALIFASPEPLSLKALTRLLDSEPKEDVAIALIGLKEDYERPGGLQLVEVAGGYQIVTRHDLHEWVRRLFHERSTQKLSAQALETLAVVAYRQPITAVEITEIRGVNTSGVLNTLLERHLIKIVGRKAVVGRPFMYSTTKEFLIRFGLNDLTDLPRVEDMVDALGLEAPLLVERAPLEDQLPLEEPDVESDAGPLEDSGEPDDAGGRGNPDEPGGRS